MNTETDIEAEVQARIEFKMNEFLTGIKNAVKYKYGQAFDMTQKSQYIWQAFEEIEQMFKKEIWMPPPYNDMVKRRKWEAKETAVNEIMESIRTTFRGYNSNGRDRIVRSIVSAVEKAQNF